MNEMLRSILCIVLGYLLGSIPFALVIGKLMFKTDVREYGSGNLGGTNAGRVLGKEVGAIVIVLDALKVVLAVGIAQFVSPVTAIWTGLSCCIGHCFPVFAGFRGGKAVACTFGFLLSCWYFIFHNPWMFFAPLLMFLIILYLFKFVSLASICAVITSSIVITGYLPLFQTDSILMILASWLMTLLVINRHASNIKKIRKGTENKISWL